MKNLLVFFIATLTVFKLYSQNLEAFEGKIDKYPIKMVLNIDSINVYGYYYYTEHGKPIRIIGKKDNNKIVLDEINEIKGTWETEKSATITINENSGLWKSDTKSFIISLKKIQLNNNWKYFKNKVELVHTFNNGKTQSYPIGVSLIYPENDDLINLIFPEIINVKRKSYANIWEYFNNYTIERFSEYLSASFSENTHQYYEESLIGQVQFITDSIISYKTSGYSYSGGVHGYAFENFYVFNTKINKRLVFNDLFIEGSEGRIADLILEKDNKEHKKEDFIKNLNNFYVTDKGIGFVFNPYVIDCYACGIYNYFFKFKELAEVMK